MDSYTVQEVPSVSSSAGSGQHSDPVWQVCWVDRGLEQEERLVTISTDGRVTQWATTKARHLPFSLSSAARDTTPLWLCSVIKWMVLCTWQPFSWAMSFGSLIDVCMQQPLLDQRSK